MTQKTDEVLLLQPVVIKQLQTIYEKNRIAHAYIFDGSEGSGKKAVSTFFMKLLLCEKVSNNVPCETCRNCLRVTSGNHPNIRQVEREGQFIKVEQIRNLMAEMTMTASEEGKKIYIIHDAHQLNSASANTLLKFLEEPDSDVVAILLTNQIQSILPTIRSRCQHIKFSEVPRKMMMSRLVEQGVTESMAATISSIAKDFDTAISMANDEQFAYARKTVLKLIEAVNKNVHEAMLLLHEEWLPSFKERAELEQALDLLLFAYRDIVAEKASMSTVPVYPDMQQTFKEMALQTTYEQLSQRMQAILQARQQLQRNMNRTLLMEQLMLNLQEGYTFV